VKFVTLYKKNPGVEATEKIATLLRGIGEQYKVFETIKVNNNRLHDAIQDLEQALDKQNEFKEQIHKSLQEAQIAEREYNRMNHESNDRIIEMTQSGTINTEELKEIRAHRDKKIKAYKGAIETFVTLLNRAKDTDIILLKKKN